MPDLAAILGTSDLVVEVSCPMTEPIKPQGRLRSIWERRPRILKALVYSAVFSVDHPRLVPHPEYIVAWGGKWRFRIVPERRQ